MDNVWILTNYNDWEEPVAKRMQYEGLWNKVIINREDFFEHEVLDILPKNLYNKIYPYLPQFMDMISRNSPLTQNTYAEYNIHDFVNLFNLYVNFYYTSFKKEEVNIYLTNRAPHVGFDLVAYLVASVMNLKIVILEQSLFANRFFIYSNHHDYGNFKTSKKIIPHSSIIIEKKHEKELFYMKKKKLSFPAKLRKFYVENKYIRLLSEMFHKSHRAQAIYRFRLKKDFEKNKKALIKPINLDEKFIYFALHLQPEKTTSSWGGKYVDQVLAIEHLSEIIPNDVKIYVKENPKQGYFMRGKYFYERIKRIKNVVLVPPDTSTYDLIENSLFVSTITGTVGWEAISGGKNVLVFGWGVWYKKLPGVFSFEKGVSFNEIMSYKIDFSDLEKRLNELLSLTGQGVVYTKEPGYKSIVKNYSLENNIENLSNSIKKYLYDG